MRGKGKKVVFLMEKSSIVVKGLEKRLQAEGYETISIAENFDKVEEHAKNADIFVLYDPQAVFEAKNGPKNIVLIKDQIKDKKCCMVLIGESGDKEDILREVPEFIVYTWIERPVDPETFASKIEEEIEKHDAKLAQTLASEIDETIFYKAQKTDIKEAAPDEGKRILIVDDDPAFAGMVRTWIKDRYKTDIVTAGMQAITFLMKKHVDLILLDYEMPVVDGPQVLQMLRQEETTKDIPVVFLTGVSSVEGVKRVMSLKPAGYILKSTSSENLIAVLEEKLGK